MNASKQSLTHQVSKPHYGVLDGFRGIAALVVVWYHIFEAFATSPLDQHVNHGYLAVDFFFLLSGFVVSYAYDDRWGEMDWKGFALRRLIRLHPMVVLGAVIGGAMFYTQGCEWWEVSAVSISALLVAVVMNALLIPAPVGIEVRGGGEMYPLNGPSWSLFFEYIANVLYAMVLRRLSTRVLSGWVVALAVGLGIFATQSTWGHIGVGWTMTSENMLGGSLRLLFSFSAGMLLYRCYRPMKVWGHFIFPAILLIIPMFIPRIGGEANMWLNGMYDFICVAFIFPVILCWGASLSPKASPRVQRVCKWLGDLSYPLYIIHYPFIYLYIAWVKNEGLSFTDSLWGALGLFFGCIALAYLCLKCYDEPLRRYLTSRVGAK